MDALFFGGGVFFLVFNIAITWGVAAFYISKVKKYGYDTEYKYYNDKLKFIWSMLIYWSVAFSFFCVDEIFHNEKIYKNLIYVMLILLTVMISLSLILRCIGDKKRFEIIFERLKIDKFNVLKKAILITNIILVMYYITVFFLALTKFN